MMEAVRNSETSVDNHFIRQYIPEDNSEHHTRRRENFKSHKEKLNSFRTWVTNVRTVPSHYIYHNGHGEAKYIHGE
jgi:hypothetical protein